MGEEGRGMRKEREEGRKGVIHCLINNGSCSTGEAELEHGLSWLIGILFSWVYQLVWRAVDLFSLKCGLSQVETFDEGGMHIVPGLSGPVLLPCSGAKEHFPLSKISQARAGRSGSLDPLKMGTLKM